MRSLLRLCMCALAALGVATSSLPDPCTMRVLRVKNGADSFAAPLVAGSTAVVVGSATFRFPGGDLDDLEVTYRTDAPYRMTEAHLWIGEATSGCPEGNYPGCSSKNKNPAFGLFPFNKGPFVPPVDTVVFVVPSSFYDFSDACENGTVIAPTLAIAHAALSSNQTAMAKGKPLSSSRWAYSVSPFECACDRSRGCYAASVDQSVCYACTPQTGCIDDGQACLPEPSTELECDECESPGYELVDGICEIDENECEGLEEGAACSLGLCDGEGACVPGDVICQSATRCGRPCGAKGSKCVCTSSQTSSGFVCKPFASAGTSCSADCCCASRTDECSPLKTFPTDDCFETFFFSGGNYTNTDPPQECGNSPETDPDLDACNDD